MTIAAPVDDNLVRTIRLSGRSSLVLRGATVLDGRGGVSSNSTILIEGERIVDISTSAAAPAPSASDVIDVFGRWVMPGLIDAHVHLAAGRRPTRKRDALRKRDDGLALLETSLLYGQMIRGGVTTLRSLGGEPAENAVAIRRAMLDEFLVGPRVLTAGSAILIRRTGGGRDPIEAAVRAARRNFGHFSDAVMLGSCDTRMRPHFTVPELHELAEEAHRRRIRISIRPISQVEAIAAAKSGIDSIEGLPGDANRRLISALRRYGTALVPLLSSSPHDPKKVDLVRMAFAEGVPVLAGSGWSPKHADRTLRREFAALMSAGLSWGDVLGAATWRTAKALGLGQDIGQLVPGKLAEMVVLRSDPRSEGGGLANHGQVELVVQASDSLTS